MAVWAVKVLVFGGVIFLSRFVLLVPLLLLARGVIGTVRRAAQRPPAAADVLPTYLPPPRPHPAARQFGGPASFQPHPPAAYQAAHPLPPSAMTPGGVQMAPSGPPRPGYATVHYEYPAQLGYQAALEQAGYPATLAQAGYPMALPQHSHRPPTAGYVPASMPHPTPVPMFTPVPMSMQMPVATPVTTAMSAMSSRQVMAPGMAAAPLTDPALLAPVAVRARHRAPEPAPST
jgi:hypothetical protein